MISTAASSTLDLLNGLSATVGDVVKRGSGALQLRGTISLADRLVVEEGEVRLAALLNAGGAVVEAGGTLAFSGNHQTVATVPIELRGGMLMAQGTIAQQAVVRSSVMLTADSQARATSRLGLNGTIAGVGGLSFTGGSIDIRSNNTYSGVTQVTAGTVSLVSASGLGSTAQPTIVSGGQLDVLVTTAEPLQLRGGTISLGAGLSTAQVTLRTGTLQLANNADFTSPVVLDLATDQALIAGRGRALTGGVTGTGDVTLAGTLLVEGAPLAHQGNLVSTGDVTFNIANTYTGGTQIRSRTTTVNDPGAFGGGTSPVAVAGGTLVLNKHVDREVHLNRGELRLNEAGVAFKGNIRNVGGQVATEGVVDGDIELGPSTASTLTRLRGGIYNGAILGTGNVNIRGGDTGPLKLNGANSFTGAAEVNQTVDANTPTALGSAEGATLVTFGTLNINAATDERLVLGREGRININAAVSRLPLFLYDELAPAARAETGSQFATFNAGGDYDQHLDLAQGRMEVNADVTVDSLAVRRAGRLAMGGTAVMRVEDEIELQQGVIQGRIVAPGIRKTTNNGAQLRELSAFDGDLTIAGGKVEMFGSQAFGSAAGDTIVTAGRNAQLVTRGTMDISENIFLQNAAGPDNQGAMFMFIPQDSCCGTPVVVMRGRLDLGSQGSILGGADGYGTDRRAYLSMAGPITGGTLTTVGGDMHLRIYSPLNTYTGATDVQGGSVELIGNGKLSTTSKIVLHEDEKAWDGMLYINNLEGVTTNRISETIPIEFRGGLLRADGEGTVEKLGQFNFVEGNSTLEPEGSITAKALHRSRGATAYFEGGSMGVEEAPNTINGILPWTLVRAPGVFPFGVFGKVSGGKVVAMVAADSSTDLAAAGPASNVGLTGTQSLNADKTINSLMMGSGSTLDLNGHRLTLTSGGVLGATIKNGTITAGPESGNELILQGADISANIVDGPGGPLTLTMSAGSSGVALRGANTHTGGTMINEGEVQLLSEAALPDGGDLALIGGFASVRYMPTRTKHLGRVRLAAHGAIIGSGNFSFDEVILETGELRPGKIMGGGVIRKTTIGEAVISAESPGSTFSGDIVVDEGVLHVDGLPQAKMTINGGKLQFLSGANPITLNGGELAFRDITSAVTVSRRSTMSAETQFNSFYEARFRGTLHGAGDLVFDGSVGLQDFYAPSTTPIWLSQGSPNFSGNVEIHSASVNLSRANALGSGAISIHAGGTLELWQGTGASLILANNVTLQGGQLFGRNDGGVAPRVTGNVRVEGRSFIGGLDVLSEVRLAHGSLLTTRDSRGTRFLGDTVVDGAVQVRIGRAEESNLRAGTLEFGGRIVAGAATSVLDLVNSGIDQFAITSSFHVPAARSLTILEDGEPLPLAVDGGRSVSGGGTLHNPLTVGAGGKIQPGPAVGALGLGPTTIGPGAIYEWDVNNLEGTAGGPVGWDVLDVAGTLDFDVAGRDTWTLRVMGLPLMTPPTPGPRRDSYQWLIASAEEITGFNPELAAVEIVNLAALLPNAAPKGFRVIQSSDDLLLRYTEPPLPDADFNGDGQVDATDLASWRAGFGGVSPTNAQGDADFDSYVNGDDFLLWQRRVGATSMASAGAAVPEPAAAGLLFIGLGCAGLCRRLAEGRIAASV